MQGLLRELLQAVGSQQPQRRAVLRALGSSLAGSGRHEDAAVAHLAAGDVEAAALQYQAAGEWQMALALAGARTPTQPCRSGAAEVLLRLHRCPSGSLP